MGQTVKKRLEYQLRPSAKNSECVMMLAKLIKEAAKTGEPHQLLTVKAEGKTFADLLKAIRNQVTQDNTRDILSIRKVGEKEEVQIRLKAGEKAKSLKAVISNRVVGVIVDNRGRKSQHTNFHTKDIERDAKEDSVRGGVAEAYQ